MSRWRWSAEVRKLQGLTWVFPEMPSLAWPGPGPCLLPVHCPDPLSRQLSLSRQHLLVNTARNPGHLRDSPICFWRLFVFVSGPASRGRVSVLGPGRAEVSCSAEFQELGSIRFYSELAALAGPSPARQQQARSSLASLDGFLGTDKTKLHSPAAAAAVWRSRPPYYLRYPLKDCFWVLKFTENVKMCIWGNLGSNKIKFNLYYMYNYTYIS